MTSAQVVVPSHTLPARNTVSKVPFPKDTIGPKFVNKTIHWFETYWHRNGKYPPADEILAQFAWTLEQVELLNQHPYWLKCLGNRGISAPVANGLEPLQVAAISMITNFSDSRSPVAKMASIQVTNEQLNGWYANPEFRRELQNRTEVSLENSHPEVQAHLMRQIANGNFQATRFYYEITGRASTPEQLNLRTAVQSLVEAIQKHVQDPEILRAISDEMALKGLLQ